MARRMTSPKIIEMTLDYCESETNKKKKHWVLGHLSGGIIHVPEITRSYLQRCKDSYKRKLIQEVPKGMRAHPEKINEFVEQCMKHLSPNDQFYVLSQLVRYQEHNEDNGLFVPKVIEQALTLYRAGSFHDRKKVFGVLVNGLSYRPEFALEFLHGSLTERDKSLIHEALAVGVTWNPVQVGAVVEKCLSKLDKKEQMSLLVKIKEIASKKKMELPRLKEFANNRITSA